jgi:hypothetical protein
MRYGRVGSGDHRGEVEEKHTQGFRLAVKLMHGGKSTVRVGRLRSRRRQDDRIDDSGQAE